MIAFKTTEIFCRIPSVYEPLVNLAVNGFCRARLSRDALNLFTSHKDIQSQPTPIEGDNTSARSWPSKILKHLTGAVTTPQ